MAAAAVALRLYPADTVSGNALLSGSIILVEGRGMRVERRDPAVMVAGAREREKKVSRVDETLEIEDVLPVAVSRCEGPEIGTVSSGSSKKSI